MDEDILTLMEALTTHASDTDPDPMAAASAGVASPGHTVPLEDALCTACRGGNMRQKTVHKKETEEARDTFSLSPCLRAEVPGPCMNVAPEVSSGTSGGDNGRKKSSRKRRNQKKSKKVYLSWPVMLQTQASSTSPFPYQASVVEAPLSSKDQKRKKEKVVTLAQFWQEPAGTLLPQANLSLERVSVTAKKGRKAQGEHHCKKRAKNQKIESSPWPVTVQAWASFVSSDLVQTSFMDSLPAASGGIENDVSVLTLSKGTKVNIIGSPAPLVQALREEMAPDVNTKRKIKEKKRHKGWRGKKGNVLGHTWPLETQAWAPFQGAVAADPVQTLSEDLLSPQWECWPPLESEDERKYFIPWSKATEEGPFFSAVAPLQISLKGPPVMSIGQFMTDKAKWSPSMGEKQLQGSEALSLESYQSWGNREKYQGSQDEEDWEYSILDWATRADYSCGALFSQEGSEASPIIRSSAHTSISEAEIDRQEAEEGKATFQTLWMGKWGGFYDTEEKRRRTKDPLPFIVQLSTFGWKKEVL